jgi:hypothetical protein
MASFKHRHTVFDRKQILMTDEASRDEKVQARWAEEQGKTERRKTSVACKDSCAPDMGVN